MNSKLSLILFGALITLAVLSAAENQEENSLSEEVSASRLARAADADPGKSKKKSMLYFCGYSEMCNPPFCACAAIYIIFGCWVCISLTVKFRQDKNGSGNLRS